MKTIYKYRLPVSELFTLDMPFGAKLLTVSVQGDVAVLWAFVDTKAPPAKRGFKLMVTGQDCEMAASDKYVGTFTLRGEVVHVFDAGEGWA